MNSNRLFVYGTLMRGSDHPMVQLLSRGADFIGEARCQGRLYLVKHYPGLVLSDDPDAVPLDFDWSDAVLVIPPKKKAISIRVDEDVLDYFKSEGDGYQRRINAVLRSYMQQKAKPKKRA